MNENILKMARDLFKTVKDGRSWLMPGGFTVANSSGVYWEAKLRDKVNPLRDLDFNAAPVWVIGSGYDESVAVPISGVEELAEFILNGNWENLK